MGIKQLKILKEELTTKLKEEITQVVSGPEANVVISDDLERIVITLSVQKQNKETLSTNVTENILIYNVKDSGNLFYQGTSKNIFYKNGAISGYSSEHSQIDLTTLYMLQQFIFKFCLDNELIEEKEEEITLDNDQVEMDGEE
jgi:phosphoribosyl-AMP cyclohydrolase